MYSLCSSLSVALWFNLFFEFPIFIWCTHEVQARAIACCGLHFLLLSFTALKLHLGSPIFWNHHVHDSTEAYESNFTAIMWNWQRSYIHSHFQAMTIFLWKVIDSSDVIIQVLDARDPMGTRSQTIESYLKKEKSWKHLIFVLNKCDLIPTWVTVWNLLFPLWLQGVTFVMSSLGTDFFSQCPDQKRWVAVLSQDYPTLAFHASLTNSFGKGSLIQLLRQFGKVSTREKPKTIPSFCLEAQPQRLLITKIFLYIWLLKDF